MAAIRPIKVWFGVKEGSVQWTSVRASKEFFAEAELLSKLGGQKDAKCSLLALLSKRDGR
jgi:hypothetical protein